MLRGIVLNHWHSNSTLGSLYICLNHYPNLHLNPVFSPPTCPPPKIYLYFKRADCRDLQTMFTNRLNVFLQKIFIYETDRRFIEKKMIIK